MTVDEIREIEIKFSNGHVDMVRVDAESWLGAVGILFQAFSVGAFQRYGLK